MNTKFLLAILSVSLSTLGTGCEDNKEILFDELNVTAEEMEVVHPILRDKPYPREEHTLYLNPTPLIVPGGIRASNEFLEFELSQDMNFPVEGTYRSRKLPYNVFNIHKEMPAGDWYWRFRVVDSADKASVWSETIKFTVIGNEEVFVTPEWSEFERNIPQGHPRLFCFFDKNLPVQNLTDNAEYKLLKPAIDKAMNYEIPPEAENPYAALAHNGFGEAIKRLRDAYVLAQTNEEKEKCQQKLLALAEELLAFPFNNVDDVTNNNSYGSFMAESIAVLYDYSYNKLNDAQRKQFIDILEIFIKRYADGHRGSLENRLYENHVWQFILKRMLFAAFTICDQSPVAMRYMEYVYELWTGRGPAHGFNRDGDWMNGLGYFGTNVDTLWYISILYSHLTGKNFLEHPWFKNYGKAIMYSWLPGTCETSFGDQVGEYGYAENGKLQNELADYLARENNDANAAWYVQACRRNGYDPLRHNNATTLRLYRIVRGHISYGVEPTTEFDNFLWNKDCGTGTAYSDMESPETNTALAFRSSPFGSGSHMLADQNSFKLTYKGDYVYDNVGHYKVKGKFELLQYRNTRGHNTIMVNGIGQAFTTLSYGNISQGLNGDNLAYFLGDASHAYYPYSEGWNDSFTSSGISQTPEYGFGENPLNKYRRHIFLLRPNKVLIYDDLGADVPATWQWLLHSKTEFHISGNKVTTDYKKGFSSVAQIFSDHRFNITKTNEWFMNLPAKVDGKEIAKEWHLTANFEACATNRILTVIQLGDTGESVDKIWRANNNFVVGDWNITAEMDGDKPATLIIINEKEGVIFNYGDEVPMINGVPYQRTQTGSSVLYDKVKGVEQVQECTERNPISTRTIR